MISNGKGESEDLNGKRGKSMAEADALSIERSIQKKYRKELWTPFVQGIKKYHLLSEGDRVAVCISGGKDSMLLAKLMQMLQRISDFPFEVRYLVMDPGYSPANRARIEENARKLDIPISIFETDIFDVANKTEKNPCYLCARMRRGHLYSHARSMGCNKIALGHHFNDVIETTMISMLYGAQLQGMMPRIRAANFEGMELIRPLYCVHEDAIIAWSRYNDLSFIRCACRFTEQSEFDHEGMSKRKEIKELLRQLCLKDPDIEQRIFASLHAVNTRTFPGWREGGEDHSFLEWYETE